MHSLSSSTSNTTNGDQVPHGMATARQGLDEGGVLAEEPVGVFCPACRSQLQLGTIDNCQFAGCPDCGGMLFQKPVFARVVHHLRAIKPATNVMPQPMDSRQLDVRRICPTCQELMETHPYGGPGNAVIDSCTPCGVIFLDRGELSKLANAPGRR